MRLSDVINLGKELLVLGIAVAIVVAVGILLGYKLIYKKMLKGKKDIKIRQLARYAIFACYLAVVCGATMLRRGEMWGDMTQLHLFYAYKEAWNTFSTLDWRYIILNILMLVPFGFLFPIVFGGKRKEKCDGNCGGEYTEKGRENRSAECRQESSERSSNEQRPGAFWKTYLAGFIFIVFIECMQLVLKRGIFDVDDIFNNMLGTMIGYGFYRIWCVIISCIKKQKKNLLPVFLYQLPLLVTAGAFAIIFTAHANKELGNLKSQYIYQRKNVTVTSDASYSDEEKEAPVYRVHVGNADEARKFAEEFFAMLGTRIDESRTDIYDETAVYHDNGNHSVWIDYVGNVYSYTDFETMFGADKAEMNAGASEEEIRDALEKFNITIPTEAEFVNSGEGNYAFYADKLLIDDILYNGNIACTYTEDQVIADFTNRIITYEPYKEFAIISEKEAFEQLKAGKFNWGNKDALDIKVIGAELDYETDSKGYYQPVYRFDVEIAREEYSINIPAVK